MDGWISLHRKITKWEWYTDGNTMRVFLHLLIMANHEDRTYRGVEIKRGQFLTGRKQLSEDLKLSEKQIRIALQHLKRTNEVAIKTTNKYSLVTLVNYEFYQGEDGRGANKRASKRANQGPAKGHKQECNNLNNKEYTAEFEEIYSAYPRPENKAQTYKNYQGALKEYSHEELMRCVRRYKESDPRREKKYTKSSSNFFGRDAVYLDYTDDKCSDKPQSPRVIPIDRRELG